MRSLLIMAMLLCAAPLWGAPRFAVQLDHRNDRVVKRIPVPSVANPQGEVQVVRRGGLVVVQTLLASRVLKRAAGGIVDKEEKTWPPGSAGHVGSLRYRDELHQAVRQAWEAFRRREDREEKRQFLLIEFILGPRRSLVALSIPVYRGKLGSLGVVDKTVLKVWRAPRDYVRRNSAAIVADSFGLSNKEAEALLEPQGN